MTLQAMAIANDQTLTALINSASRRLVYMAPGISMSLAKVIADCFNRMPTEWITIIVDVDAEGCRMGYGEITAIEHLEQVSRERNCMVLRQPGVRIGLVIADDQTLVFAPTPQLIEAAPKADLQQPNAIRIGLPPADLERDLGLGPEGLGERSIGLDKATLATINAAKADLQANPPQRFDISRTVRVFNARFEFVEFSMKGASIDRKSVNLPVSLLGLTGHERSLETRLHLATDQNTPTARRLHRLKAGIIRHYLKHLPGYGFIVLRKDKPGLLHAVDRLTHRALKAQRRIWREVQRQLERKRKELLEALLPLVESDKSQVWRSMLGCPDPKTYLEGELRSLLGRCEELVKPIEVRLVFKAVTYESLTDPMFIALVHDKVPELKQLHDEFNAATAKSTTAPRDEVKGVA